MATFDGLPDLPGIHPSAMVGNAASLRATPAAGVEPVLAGSATFIFVAYATAVESGEHSSAFRPVVFPEHFADLSPPADQRQSRAG